MPESHSHPVNGVRAHWWSERLWRLAEELTVERVAIDEIAEFDMDCWFKGIAPTCRDVAIHARRICQADLSHPVILAADGQLMDGGHRIAKAWLQGDTQVNAVRFRKDPEPDWVTAD